MDGTVNNLKKDEPKGGSSASGKGGEDGETGERLSQSGMFSLDATNITQDTLDSIVEKERRYGLRFDRKPWASAAARNGLFERIAELEYVVDRQEKTLQKLLNKRTKARKALKHRNAPTSSDGVMDMDVAEKDVSTGGLIKDLPFATSGSLASTDLRMQVATNSKVIKYENRKKLEALMQRWRRIRAEKEALRKEYEEKDKKDKNPSTMTGDEFVADPLKRECEDSEGELRIFLNGDLDGCQEFGEFKSKENTYGEAFGAPIRNKRGDLEAVVGNRKYFRSDGPVYTQSSIGLIQPELYPNQPDIFDGEHYGIFPMVNGVVHTRANKKTSTTGEDAVKNFGTATGAEVGPAKDNPTAGGTLAQTSRNTGRKTGAANGNAEGGQRNAQEKIINCVSGQDLPADAKLIPGTSSFILTALSLEIFGSITIL